MGGQTPDFDLFTYSFPCQDISIGGYQKGFSEGSGSRSSLLWECEKAIEIKRPKYLLMENVKMLVSKKFISDFKKWQDRLESIGYSNFYKVLNAKDYGIPQDRERVFMVSILDSSKEYKFPGTIKGGKRLEDIAETSVDETFYLSGRKLNDIINRLRLDDDFVLPKVVSFSRDGKGKIISNHLKEIANTITTVTGSGWSTDAYVAEVIDRINNRYRIRKFTPMECGRLMGVSDNDIQKMMNAGLNKTILYKLFGNSIVVDVLYHIFRKMFVETQCEDQQLSLFDF